MNRTDGKTKHKACLYLRLPALFLVFSLLAACSELQKPTPEPFYSETAPPQKKEFRWSNGKTPKSFDPALASAAPETDIVRAIYEGLTDVDAKTLETVPAIAVQWTSSVDYKTWTFKLRPDVRWSNNERVTANDFARSWKRLSEMGDKVPHYKLLKNIVGMRKIGDKETAPPLDEDIERIISNPLNGSTLPYLGRQPDANSTPPRNQPKTTEPTKNPSADEKKAEETKFGVEATDDFTLVVSLINADKDFPALVAHPVFRPVYGDGSEFEAGKLNANIVTNGAFRIFSIGQDGITLDRAEHFWNKDKIQLERVRFVPTENAEKALEAYRAGEVDAVTNADFEPLALKLLTPYDDFRRTTHSAINFYEFNLKKAPFNDRRVREALAISIERERLTEGEMEGATKPALSFLPFKNTETKLVQDSERAKTLLSEAGFPEGSNFPIVKLLVNRNDVQQRIARSVAKMWKQNLNVETEIVSKETVEIETARLLGDFDLMRRGVVLPTSDETANMLAIFAPDFVPIEVKSKDAAAKDNGKTEGETANSKTEAPVLEKEKNANTENTAVENQEALKDGEGKKIILTEEDAILELPAIPLYFPTSYSLVKPYILGFEINTLDAPSLKDVSIDTNWQPKKPDSES